jgi:hypothetical protein
MVVLNVCKKFSRLISVCKTPNNLELELEFESKSIRSFMKVFINEYYFNKTFYFSYTRHRLFHRKTKPQSTLSALNYNRSKARRRDKAVSHAPGIVALSFTRMFHLKRIYTFMHCNKDVALNT